MFKYTPENDDYVSPSTCLEETFYILSKKNAVYRVKLSEKGLCLQKEYGGNVKTETIQLEDIIGCRCMRSKRFNQKCVWHPRTKYLTVADDEGENCTTTDWDESDVSAYLYLYAYVFKKRKRRERVVITLRFRSFDRYEDNLREANKWKTSVHFLMNTRVEKTFPSCFFSSEQFQIDNKVLFILNPKSGVGKSKRTFQNKVVPLLTEADINYDVYVTKHSFDARNMIRTQNLWQYMGGIVAVSGDGIVSEVLNGILTRPDWKTVLTQVKLGVLPAGSGNGLAKSISYADNEPYDQNPILVSTLNVVRGFSTPLDVVRIETTSQVMYSFLSIGWGMISDVDIGSERLRALGSPRFTIWALAKVAGMKSYKGVVSYLPAKIKVEKIHKLSLSPDGNDDLDDKQVESSDDEGRRDSFYSAGSRRSAYLSVSGSSYESLAEDVIANDSSSSGAGSGTEYGPSSRIPPLGSPLPPEWVVLKGEFLMVHASYPTHIASDTIFAPNAKLNDGCMWLIIIRSNVSRALLIQMLLGLSTGAHTSINGVNYLPVTALRIEPEKPENGRPCGLLTVDGELIPTGPVQAEVIPHTVQVFSRR